MGVELTSDSGCECYVAHIPWLWLLNVAMDYGWKPAGTKDASYGYNPQAGWNGSYFSNCGQYITAADATAISAGLSLAILDQAQLSIMPPGLNERYIALLTKMKDFFLKGGFRID